MGAPTASTFCLNTTSVPGLSNVNGEEVEARGKHNQRGKLNTFGKRLGEKKPTGTLVLEQASMFKRTGGKKPSIPKREDPPIYGLVTDKNFIVANAVENILAVPKKLKEDEFKYTNKRDYGKVPVYLKKVNEKIQDEFATLQQIREENNR